MSSRAHSSQARRSLFGFIRVAQPLFGESDQQVVSPRPARAAALLLLFLLLLQGVAGAEARVARRVLVLYEVGPNYPAIAVLDQGISDALRIHPTRSRYIASTLTQLSFPTRLPSGNFASGIRASIGTAGQISSLPSGHPHSDS